MIENVPMVVMLVDQDRRVRKANIAAAGFARRPGEEMVGQRGGEALGCLHAADSPEGCGFGPSCGACSVSRLVMDTFRKGVNYQGADVRLPFEHNGKREDRALLVSTSLVTLFAERMVILCLEDVTDRKHAEEELRELNEELKDYAVKLQAANHDMEGFGHAASHDLREPLMIIDGFSRLLLKKYGKDLDDKGREMLSIITGTTEKMSQLINDLLSFARVSAKGVVKSGIGMRGLVRDVFEEMQPAIAGRRVQLDIRDLPLAWGDPSMIRQVLTNLLSNALKFTRPREKAKIEIRGSVKGGETVFCVTDNGIGFTKEQGEKLFGYFKRLHSADQFEGTGLGLVITKRIIEKHGGRVWAEGKAKKGAKFYFALPRQDS
jgi:two-component system sensor kinase